MPHTPSQFVDSQASLSVCLVTKLLLFFRDEQQRFLESCDLQRKTEARVCHRKQYCPVAFPSTSGRDARGHQTPRPQRDRGVPGAPGESRLLGILCARSQSGPDGGASTSRALREGVDRDVLGLTRHAASPTANKRQACRPAPCDARGTPAPQSQHTHSRSHSGTPHGQHSDACIFL